MRESCATRGTLVEFLFFLAVTPSPNFTAMRQTLRQLLHCGCEPFMARAILRVPRRQLLADQDHHRRRFQAVLHHRCRPLRASPGRQRHRQVLRLPATELLNRDSSPDSGALNNPAPPNSAAPRRRFQPPSTIIVQPEQLVANLRARFGRRIKTENDPRDPALRRQVKWCGQGDIPDNHSTSRGNFARMRRIKERPANTGEPDTH